jgi:hypothetical protein
MALGQLTLNSRNMVARSCRIRVNAVRLCWLAHAGKFGSMEPKAQLRDGTESLRLNVKHFAPVPLR